MAIFTLMLASALIAARMRVLQIDLEYSNGQRWSQICFFIRISSGVLQTLMVVRMPLLRGLRVQEG